MVATERRIIGTSRVCSVAQGKRGSKGSPGVAEVMRLTMGGSRAFT
jgi:hypothetical protein